MLDLFHTGIIIGILVSAPMGPIGMLCIQRTLSKGRWYGFVSGLGAALSDLLYAAITSLFMGLVVDFISAYQRPLQIVGSIIIALFGIFIFRSNPAANIQNDSEEKQSSYIQDFVTAFLLTFSNISIVFLYIALFANFRFVLPEFRMAVAGLTGVAVGAVLWWLLITFLVSRMRPWFNLRGLKRLNMIVGSAVIILAVVVLFFDFNVL